MQPPTIDLLQPTETLGDVTNNPVISSNQLRPVSLTTQSRAAVRTNTVGHVTIHGQPIVSLVIDAKERLCLAQISNTLLKDFSYNEIHNRRVALGITCVQCTPVQLEILRRAGAMPVSSRRCGMITRREAERLVRSFLDEIGPPRLPDDFAFEVRHACGWGCRGSFLPSRYNSSRAKCIKCTYCAVFFSPNKFIFHFHRTPDSTYNHPDAANFNSWRRHLFLSESSDEHLQHAWEDVKAMFNGGSRKRDLPLTSHSHSKSYTPSPSIKTSQSTPLQTPPSEKRQKLESSTDRSSSSAHLVTSGMVPSPHISQFSYPLFPVANRVLPGQHMPAPYALALHADKEDTLRTAPFPVWPTQPKPICPSYESLWAKHLGIGSETPYLTSVSVKIGTNSMADCNVNIGMIKTPEYSVERTGSLLQKDSTYTSAFKRVGVWNPATEAAENRPPSVTRTTPCGGGGGGLQAVRYYEAKPASSYSNGHTTDNDSESENEHVDVDTVCDTEPGEAAHNQGTGDRMEINNNACDENKRSEHDDISSQTEAPTHPIIDSQKYVLPGGEAGPCDELVCRVPYRIPGDRQDSSQDGGHRPCAGSEAHPGYTNRAPEADIAASTHPPSPNRTSTPPQQLPPYTRHSTQHSDHVTPLQDEEVLDEPRVYGDTTTSQNRSDSPPGNMGVLRALTQTQNVTREEPNLHMVEHQDDARDSAALSRTPTPPPAESEESHDAIPQDSELSKEELLRRLNRALSARQKLEEDCRVLTDTLFRKLNEEREVREHLQEKLREAQDTLHNLPEKPVIVVPHDEYAEGCPMEGAVSD